MQVIPLNSNPNQSFNITLSVDNKNLTLGFYIAYNEIAGYWFMNIADKDGNKLLSGIPLLVGYNLLRQYKYLNIGSAYMAKIDNITDENANSSNLGTSFQLLWGDTP